MTMTQTQGQALAAFVARIRTDWDQPGILAAIAKAQTLGTPVQVARALINLADNTDLRTPAILAQPGSHWLAPDGSHVQRRGDNDVRCPDHSMSVMPCPQCEAKRCDPTDDYLAAKAALPKRAPSPTQRHLADIERERAADKEARRG